MRAAVDGELQTAMDTGVNVNPALAEAVASLRCPMALNRHGSDDGSGDDREGAVHCTRKYV